MPSLRLMMLLVSAPQSRRVLCACIFMSVLLFFPLPMLYGLPRRGLGFESCTLFLSFSSSVSSSSPFHLSSLFSPHFSTPSYTSYFRAHSRLTNHSSMASSLEVESESVSYPLSYYILSTLTFFFLPRARRTIGVTIYLGIVFSSVSSLYYFSGNP